MEANRAIVIVLDGCGAGETADSPEYGDHEHPNTLRHVWDACSGVAAPNLIAAGWFAAASAGPVPDAPTAAYGRLRPLSKGKDSVTGHWEMMGIVLQEPFPTFPDGFPIDLVKEFEDAIGTQTLANRPASGTAIISELGQLHVETGFPIVYTSADSVFQIACHESVVPVEQLYEWCRIARRLCTVPNNVQRVIARPFEGDFKSGFTRTQRRKDFPLEPAPNLVDQIGDVFGIGVVPELFNGRGFRAVERTQSNAEHEKLLLEALQSDARFIFANFEDTDMLFGHRNDPIGFGQCLERFDETLAKVLGVLRPSDRLLITADHGNDPTDSSTDHSREYCPLVVFGGETGPFGGREGLAEVGRLVASHLGLPEKK